MTQQTTARRPFWARLWNGLKAWDDALHADPTDPLKARIKALEQKIADLEAPGELTTKRLN